ncbi:MAG: PAS domain S-box protein, partial [Colwellia sp.]|nr:PAS domain S-box protein [Colwellia sp.]
MESSEVTSLLSHQYELNDPLHQLFDVVDAIAVQGYDENRQVIYWNKGSELLYGYSKEEALGRRLEDLIIPESFKPSVIEDIQRWLEQGIAVPASELTLRHKDGQDVNIYSSHVLFTNQNNKKQLYCIDVNLADVKHAQAQTTFKEHMLEAAFEAIPDLFFLMEEDGTII